MGIKLRTLKSFPKSKLDFEVLFGLKVSSTFCLEAAVVVCVATEKKPVVLILHHFCVATEKNPCGQNGQPMPCLPALAMQQFKPHLLLSLLCLPLPAASCNPLSRPCNSLRLRRCTLSHLYFHRIAPSERVPPPPLSHAFPRAIGASLGYRWLDII
ncbi:hypothetical protein SUGI_1124310 [Cryptomeria japonica]|nr:hypothetical protein SUGI_1124310 [Cryptomeria japonica]